MSKGFGMEQVITQLAFKILFDDYSGFYDEEDNYFTREAEIIIDIVYGLDKDWFRILTLERDIYYIVLLKCDKIISYVPLGCIFILELFIIRNIETKYS